MSDLHELLKTRTAGLHERLETLPFFRALHDGDLPALAIVSFLEGLAIIHAVLERSLAEVLGGPIAELRQHVQPKIPLLLADLDTLGAASLPSISSAIEGALGYAADILTKADNPFTLIGPLYVLEGSQNGGLALKRAYASCLGVPKDQLSYIGCYGSRTAAHWKAFTHQLDLLPLTEDSATQVVESAIDCFEQLAKICAALFPYSDQDLKHHHVAGINFEAGNHAMPQNPLEIALALRAAAIAWKEHPYLECRFGERGQRFTRSDSCWLVALTHLPVDTVTKSLSWLRAVLASRGIPTVILKGHLQAIRRAIGVDFPDQTEMRSRFDPFLSSLEAEPQALGVAEAHSQLIKEFDPQLRACAGLKIAFAPELITSAWIDERVGIGGSFAAVRDWFIDSRRFSSGWITCVNDFVDKLNQAVRPSC